MVATTYGVANPINGAGSKSKGFFARLFEAIADSQMKRAKREVAYYKDLLAYYEDKPFDGW